MFVLQYDFKIEFFGYKVNEKGKIEKNNFGVPQVNWHEHLFVIETDNGSPEVHISYTNLYSSVNTIIGKQCVLKIYNLPMYFHSEAFVGHVPNHAGVRLSYKKHQFITDYIFMGHGIIQYIEETEYPDCTLEMSYQIKLMGDVNYENEPYRAFDKEKQKMVNNPIQLKGLTIQQIIEKGFPNRAIMKMSSQELSRVFKKEAAASTPLELERILLKGYVKSIYGTMGLVKLHYDNIFIFTGHNPPAEEVKYENLHDYGLIHIPQKQFVHNQEFNYLTTRWNCEVLYTTFLRPTHSVFFYDTLGQKVECTIHETSATLSNVGDCLLKLHLYDNSNEVSYLTVYG